MREDDEPGTTMMAAPLSTQSDALIEAVFDPKRDHTYQPYRVFAEGGMGRILEARDHQLQRRVVLKVLQTDAPELRERFLREALITAKLQHPAIVPIYDFGQWSHQRPDTHLGLRGGEPYYVMKMVEGQSLGERMTAGGELHERLAMLRHVITAAEAIAYAHERRVIHRDLKPDNILVGAFGETVVIDWGLAKELPLEGEEQEQEQEQAASSSTATVDEALLALGETLIANQNQDIPSSGQRLTLVGTVMGTPDYMSPEQAAAGDVDFRADVWSLGAILYELLAGETPYGGNTVNEKMKLILSGPPIPLHLRVKGLPQDLAAIVAKAMAHLPDERYPSARELMDDLRRFETGQIVSAHRYTTRERVQRFITRHKVAFGVAALALVTVLALSVFAVSRIIAARNIANQQRDKAKQERKTATRHADQLVLLQARAATRANPNAALSWLATLSPEATDWDEVRLLASDARSQGLSKLLRDHNNTVGKLRFSPDGRYLATMSDDHTARLYRTDNWQSRLLDGASDEVWHGAFSPDSRKLLVRTKDQKLLIWALDKQQPPIILQGHKTRLNDAVFSPNGERIASWGNQRGLWLWDVAKQKGELIHPTERTDIKIGASLDMRKIAWISDNGMLTVWDWQGQPQTLLGHHKKQISRIALSAEGQFIASGSSDGEIRIWSQAGGSSRNYQLYEKLRFLRPIPKSNDFITTSFDGKVDRLNPSTGTVRHLAQDPSVAFGLAISDDGDKVAWCTSESVRFMELSTGRLKTLRGFEKRITNVALSPDGGWVAAASEDFSVRLWRIAELDGQRVAYWPKARSWAFTPSFDIGAALSRHGRLQAGTLDTPQRYDTATYAAKVLALSPDGSTIATGFKSGKIHVIERNGGTTRTLLGHAGPVRQLSFTPDGRLISGGQDGRLLAWRKPFNKPQLLAQLSQSVTALALSADGKLMAASSTNGELLLWSGQERVELPATPAQPIHALTFTPDGTTLLAGSEDYSIRAFDTATHAQRFEVSHQLQIGKIVVSPSGKRFASLTMEIAGVQVWDMQTGERLMVNATSHRGPILDAAFSPDDTRLATAGSDHDVRLWELKIAHSRVLSGHTAPVTHVRFADDGQSLMSAARDGAIRRWYEDMPRGEQALRSWLSANAGEPIADFRD